ncbi:hypothetical protein HVTV-2_gp147 [Haloarcula virus HVTV-2]|nr:hypothetical protein HVTV-2_gp147 [Haloarcula virus HVTV-2]
MVPGVVSIGQIFLRSIYIHPFSFRPGVIHPTWQGIA